MAMIRRDEAQLVINIDAKESNEYQKMLQSTAAGVQSIKKLTQGTEEYTKALNEQAAMSQKLSKSDYLKLSTKQIQDRRAQLVQLQRIMPQVTFAEAGFQKELQQVNTALAVASQRTKAVNKDLNDSAGVFTRLGRTIVGVAGGFALWEGAKSIFKGTIGSAIELASQFETTSQSFKILIGDQERAKELMEELNQFATATPFKPAEVQAAAKTLLGYGRSAETVISDIEILGNAAAATGADIQGLSLVFGQVAGAGKLMSQDAMQFINQGIPVYQLLGDMLGKTAGEVKELQSEGKITFDMLREAFVLAAEDGGKFAGALEAQSKTMSGLLSTMKGNLDEFVKRIGDKIVPVLKPVLDFLGQFFKGLTDNLFEGKEAVGEFANVINTTADVIRYVGDVLATIVAGLATFLSILRAIPEWLIENRKALGLLAIAILSFNASMIASQAAILGATIASKAKAAADTFLAVKTKVLTIAQQGLNAAMKANPIGFVIGLVAALASGMVILYNNSEQVRRVVGGLWSALKQGVENAINGIKLLAVNMQIFGKEVQIAITFNSDKRRALREELDELRKMKSKYAQAGKTLGEAFREGYNDPKHAKKSKEAAEETVATFVDDSKQAMKKQPTLSDMMLDGEKKKGKTKKEKEKKLITIADPNDAEERQKYLEYRIASIKELNDIELKELEKMHLSGQMSEEAYNLEKIRIAKAATMEKMDLLVSLGEEENDLMLDLQVEALKQDKALFDERVKQIQGLEMSELDALESQFLKKLISEEEYQLARLKIQSDYFAEQLRLLEENGATETEAYKKITKEKMKADAEYDKKKTEIDERHLAMQWKIMNEGMSAYSGLLAAGSEFLSADEKNKKKHGETIRAFQLGEIMVNGLAEISGIFKSTAGWGPIGWAIGIGQAAAAGLRTAAAMSKVKAQQFWRGGQIKSISGQYINEAPNIPTLAGGDNVLIAAKPGEVVLNRDQQQRAGGANFFRSIGVPGFATGGIIPSLPSTTPTISPNVLGTAAPQQGSDPMMAQVLNAMQVMTQSVAEIPKAVSNMNLKTHVVYSDVESVGAELNDLRRLSSY